MKSIESKKKIYSLESLRGIAALFVTLFHYPSSSFLYFDKGFYAVNFFFILSGFVISYNYEHKIKNFKDIINFQIKRFFRLYPIHVFVLLVILSIQILKFIIIEFTALPFGSEAFGDRYTFKDLISNLFLIHSVFNFSYWLSWNPASWSISTEFYTYIVFALIFFLFQRYKFLIIFLILLLASPFFIENYNYFSLPNKFSYINGVFFQCLFNFGCGCICYYLYLKIRYHFNDILVFIFFLFCLSIYYFSDEILIKYNFLIFSLIVLIFSKLKKKSLTFKIFNFKPLIFLGTISYSLYMIHETVIYLLIQVLRFIFKVNFILDGGTVVHTYSPLFDTIITITYLILSLWISAYMYNYIEKKFRVHKK